MESRVLLLAVIGFVAVTSAAARGLSDREGARRTHRQSQSPPAGQQPPPHPQPPHQQPPHQQPPHQQAPNQFQPMVTPSTCSEQVTAVRTCAANLTPIITQIFDKLMANQVVEAATLLHANINLVHCVEIGVQRHCCSGVAYPMAGAQTASPAECAALQTDRLKLKDAIMQREYLVPKGVLDRFEELSETQSLEHTETDFELW